LDKFIQPSRYDFQLCLLYNAVTFKRTVSTHEIIAKIGLPFYCRLSQTHGRLSVLIHRNFGQEILEIVMRITLLNDGGGNKAEMIPVFPHNGLGYQPPENVGKPESDISRQE